MQSSGKFQSRNGLIWTYDTSTCAPAGYRFQSRNGLIWTHIDCDLCVELWHISIPQRSDLNTIRSLCPLGLMRNFNPATVWFERPSNLMILELDWNFNPATVWFELFSNGITSRIHPSFQSRNGLIWTYYKAEKGGYRSTFQSRNGLIWTQHHRPCAQYLPHISIPQRSDLNGNRW